MQLGLGLTHGGHDPVHEGESMLLLPPVQADLVAVSPLGGSVDPCLGDGSHGSRRIAEPGSWVNRSAGTAGDGVVAGAGLAGEAGDSECRLAPVQRPNDLAMVRPGREHADHRLESGGNGTRRLAAEGTPLTRSAVNDGDGGYGEGELVNGEALLSGHVRHDGTGRGAIRQVVEASSGGKGQDAVVDGMRDETLAQDNDVISGCRKHDVNNVGLGKGRVHGLDQGDGSGAVGRAVDGCRGAGPEQGDDEQGDGDSDCQCIEDQILENKLTWELARESGDVLCNDEDDIMAILQAQNEEIARKRKVAKQKAKMRRCRPKTQKQELEESKNVRKLQHTSSPAEA
ncbi:uncharacterized protein [Arachis hypogaea]|uniref:uncharacterized protein isoform X2 n=1 Tax=Arachis hypogaea TaxID=3818 RepID=UPI003B2238AA